VTCSIWPTDESAMQSWGCQPDDPGVGDPRRRARAAGARSRSAGPAVAGSPHRRRIDLETIEVQLRDRLLPEGLLLNDARLLTLDCSGARLVNDSGPALHGTGVRAAGAGGTVCLLEAHDDRGRPGADRDRLGLQILARAFAALFIAGFTGAVRKT
jgi:hypothetical protein